MDVKLILNFQTTVFCNETEELIQKVAVNELDPERAAGMPGIVIYVVKEGDNLWQIGKKYYVPVSRIKELNGLTSDHLNTGDKILIVKQV